MKTLSDHLYRKLRKARKQIKRLRLDVIECDKIIEEFATHAHKQAKAADEYRTMASKLIAQKSALEAELLSIKAGQMATPADGKALELRLQDWDGVSAAPDGEYPL